MQKEKIVSVELRFHKLHLVLYAPFERRRIHCYDLCESPIHGIGGDSQSLQPKGIFERGYMRRARKTTHHKVIRFFFFFQHLIGPLDELRRYNGYFFSIVSLRSWGQRRHPLFLRVRVLDIGRARLQRFRKTHYDGNSVLHPGGKYDLDIIDTLYLLLQFIGKLPVIICRNSARPPVDDNPVLYSRIVAPDRNIGLPPLHPKPKGFKYTSSDHAFNWVVSEYPQMSRPAAGSDAVSDRHMEAAGRHLCKSIQIGSPGRFELSPAVYRQFAESVKDGKDNFFVVLLDQILYDILHIGLLSFGINMISDACFFFNQLTAVGLKFIGQL